MSDQELLRLLDARADGIAKELRARRATHATVFEQVHIIEEEITALQNILAAVVTASRNLRNGGVPPDVAAIRAEMSQAKEKPA